MCWNVYYLSNSLLSSVSANFSNPQWNTWAIVTGGGVQADSRKILAMLSWLLPQTLKQLRGFLGLTRYYRKFVHNYVTIAAPLIELLKKDAFHWTPAATMAFDSLK